ncbi:MAG: CBS domain-containing protein [Candidatus Altiarchaeota archaeon]
MDLPGLSEVKKQRKRLSLTQSELAEKSGISQSLIARIESGTVDPRYSNIVKIFDTLGELTERQKGGEVLAKDIMTRDVVMVDALNTIESVAEKMKHYGVSQVPVIDDDKIVGSISERAILGQISKGVDAKNFSREPAKSYMEDGFPTVSPETPLNTISAILENNTAVVVQNKGNTIGIITNADMLKVVHN